MSQQGTPAVNPLGLVSPIDTNVVSYGATTLTVGASGGTSLTLAAASVFANSDIIVVGNGTTLAEIVQVISGGGTTNLTVYPAIQKAHNPGSAVSLLGVRQVMTIGDPATPANQANVTAPGTVASYGLGIQGLGTTGVPLAVTSVPSTTAVQTQPAVSTSSVQLLAANANRKAFFLQNTGTTTINVSLGVAATTSNFWLQLQQGESYSSSFGVIWQGVIYAISNLSNGVVNVTELT